MAKPSVSSPTSTLKPNTTIASIINNNNITEVKKDSNVDQEKEGRFHDDVSIWEDKAGGFKVTMLSATVNLKRKTRPPVLIDFFLNDDIKSIAAAGHQHPEEEYSDEISTQLGLLLPKKLVEDHVLVHLNNVQVAAINGNGMEIGVLDVDTDTQHRLVLKRWSTGCSSYQELDLWFRQEKGFGGGSRNWAPMG